MSPVVVYAGFVTRATALVVDGLVILVIGSVGVVIGGLILNALVPGGVKVDAASIVGAAAWQLTLTTAYFVGFWSLAGQTPGMRLMRIVVEPVVGTRLSVWRSLRRIVGMLVCWLTLGLGFALVLIDDRRQGLHDKIARTLVLYAPVD